VFKQILVALDGSETANLALDEAMTLAKECGSIVRVASKPVLLIRGKES